MKISRVGASDENIFWGFNCDNWILGEKILFLIGVGVGVLAGFGTIAFSFIGVSVGDGVSACFKFNFFLVFDEFFSRNLSKSACDSGSSSTSFAYVPGFPDFSYTFSPSASFSPLPNLLPRFSILLFIAAPADVTAPKIPPPTFFNLSLALDAALLL